MTRLLRRQLPDDSLAALAELVRILGGTRATVEEFFHPERAPRPSRLVRRRKRSVAPRRKPAGATGSA